MAREDPTLRIMHNLKISFALLCLLAAPFGATAQDNPTTSGMLTGPAKARLSSVAELQVPAGFTFIDGDQTRAMLRRAGDPVSGKELDLRAPLPDDFGKMIKTLRSAEKSGRRPKRQGLFDSDYS